MAKLICCDDVFDILTRGPFPTGDDHDDEVELHLRACHECRQLAEALRPAVGLIHEAIEEERELPSYRGALHLEAYRTSAAPRDAARHGVERALAGAARLAAAVLVIGAACLIAVAVGSWRRNHADGRPGSVTDRVTQRERDSNERSLAEAPTNRNWARDGAEFTLAALDLPRSCLTLVGLATRDERGCCTGCHAAGLRAAGLDAAPQADMARLLRSCRLCHDT